MLENRDALPRVFVPRSVKREDDRTRRLRALGAADFEPRALAYVEGADPPPGPAIGTVALVEEVPSRVTLSVDMQTPGLVVLADLWDAGWRAELDGAPVPILRTNHALRGVPVPAGSGTLVFEYRPRSFRMGIALGGTGAVAVVTWCAVLAVRSRRAPSTP